MSNLKKASVYFSAGIGDSILLIPLIKVLQKEGYTVTGIFTSKFKTEKLFKHIVLLDETVILKNLLDKIIFIFKNRNKKFDISCLNFFAASISNMIMAGLTSRITKTNKKQILTKYMGLHISYIRPTNNIHDSLQNIILFDRNYNKEFIDLAITLRNKQEHYTNIDKKVIILQFGAGNNKTPYKIWGHEKWNHIIDYIKHDFPHLKIIIVGDKNEISLSKKINIDEPFNLTGKTEIEELPLLLQNALCLIGNDSGLMHIAAALQVPTFTIWGATSEKLYAYNKFNPDIHHIVFNDKISCRPCSAWINANTERVRNPLHCPDFKCLNELAPEFVYKKIHNFLKKQINEK